MNLSNILFNNISNKLQLTSLDKEKFYIKNLFNQINKLEKTKKNYYKKFNLQTKILNKSIPTQIYYIISISFLKTNTIIHLSDSTGKIKLFYSAGNVGLKGKQKKNRQLAVTKLITLVLKKTSFIKNKPVALHLNNIKKQRLITKQLKKTLFIKIIKSFNLVPYNGCRKKKMRRKKKSKKFK